MRHKVIITAEQGPKTPPLPLEACLTQAFTRQPYFIPPSTIAGGQTFVWPPPRERLKAAIGRFCFIFSSVSLGASQSLEMGSPSLPPHILSNYQQNHLTLWLYNIFILTYPTPNHHPPPLPLDHLVQNSRGKKDTKYLVYKYIFIAGIRRIPTKKPMVYGTNYIDHPRIHKYTTVLQR